MGPGLKLYLHSYTQCDQIGRFNGVWATFKFNFSQIAQTLGQF